MEMSEEHPQQLRLTTGIWAALGEFSSAWEGEKGSGEIYLSLLYFKFIVSEDQITRRSLMFLIGGTKLEDGDLSADSQLVRG